MNYAYNITTDIINTVERLPISMQIKIRDYVHTLENTMPQKGNASKLKKYYGTLDNFSANEMSEAIEEGCEKIDVENW